MNKLYVSNLAYSTNDHSLREAFEPFGSLRSVAVISDRMTGESRGFGFVEYSEQGDAQRALEAMVARAQYASTWSMLTRFRRRG